MLYRGKGRDCISTRYWTLEGLLYSIFGSMHACEVAQQSFAIGPPLHFSKHRDIPPCLAELGEQEGLPRGDFLCWPLDGALDSCYKASPKQPITNHQSPDRTESRLFSVAAVARQNRPVPPVSLHLDGQSSELQPASSSPSSSLSTLITLCIALSLACSTAAIPCGSASFAFSSCLAFSSTFFSFLPCVRPKRREPSSAAL
jgi:hypothetical protein